VLAVNRDCYSANLTCMLAACYTSLEHCKGDEQWTLIYAEIVSFLANCTDAHSMSGCWHKTVIRPSVCLWCCELWC